jgi:apolipoprotein N-acyltransferase
MLADVFPPRICVDARLHAMRVFHLRAWVLVLISSLLQILLFPLAGPLPLWRAALSWFALAPLFAALLPGDRVWTPLQAAVLGYAGGVVWYMGTCYWIYQTMHLYGGMGAPLAFVILILFCLYLGLYHALFALLLSLVRRGLGVRAALVASPFLWISVELARARVTSFPWNLLGYAQIDNSVLTQLAPLTGVYGISFVLAAVNAAIACALVLPRRRTTAIIAMTGALIATAVQNAGTWFRPAAMVGSQKAVLMQPNLLVGAGEQGSAENLGIIFARLTLQASALDDRPTSIALWPESPSPFATNRADFTTTAAFVAQQLKAPLIAGAVGLEPGTADGRIEHLYNSAALFTPEAGLVGRYDKIHLVPFGEFVPYANLFQFAGGLMKTVTQEVGTFDRGTSRRPLTANGHRYGVFMCYESIFGDEVRQFVANGADVLTNLSDDGWYGDTSAPFQHINMARMRAIENHRWLLRDTNSGITAAIDPNGRVAEVMDRHKRGAVAVHFDYRSELTFYTLHGDVFAYLCTLLALTALVLSFVRPTVEAEAQ